MHEEVSSNFFIRGAVCFQEIMRNLMKALLKHYLRNHFDKDESFYWHCSIDELSYCF